MAASLMPIPPPLSATSSASGHNNKSDPHRKTSWWTPLFGWSPEPDYIDSANTEINIKNHKPNFSARSSESDLDNHKTVRSRITRVEFTEEKARKLRMLTNETESFHDAMYHSAIASRLASDFSHRSDSSDL